MSVYETLGGPILVQLRADILMEVLNSEQGYDRVGRLVSGLQQATSLPLRWYGGITSPRDRDVPFEDRDRLLARLDSGAVQPEEGVGVIIVSETGKRKPGRFKIEFKPNLEKLWIEIHAPDQAFGNLSANVCRDTLKAIVVTEDPKFAYADIVDRSPETGQLTSYRSAYATYPHRKCVGWMAYVPEAVTPEQVPSAAELVPVPGKGTILVSVAEAFDLNDKAHIEQANRVEMELADLGLLPVTDPSLL